jgi:hypothetical protein
LQTNDAKINQQRRTAPRILDDEAFAAVERERARYTPDLVIREWLATKKMADDMGDGREIEDTPSIDAVIHPMLQTLDA